MLTLACIVEPASLQSPVLRSIIPVTSTELFSMLVRFDIFVIVPFEFRAVTDKASITPESLYVCVHVHVKVHECTCK